MLGPDTSLGTRQKEPLKTTMSKTGDHPGSVTPRVTMSSLLTLALSGRLTRFQARGRRQAVDTPDARPRKRQPRPLERVVSWSLHPPGHLVRLEHDVFVIPTVIANS